MNKIKTRTLLATAMLGLAVSAGPVQADLFATAKLTIDNFVVLGSDGNVLDRTADFTSLSFTNSADYDGSLTGTAGFGLSIPNNQADIDFPAACLSTTGDCNPILPENSFPFLTGPQGTDFVAADQQLAGSPIDNLPGFDPVAGVSANQAAYANLSATVAEGSANANNGLESNWTFSLAQPTGMTFVGDITTYLEAFASAGELAPGKASASTTFAISITNLQTGLIVFDSNNLAAFDLLNETTSANANNFPVDIQTCGNLAGLFGGCGTELTVSPFSVTTVALDAGTLYQLSIRGNANVDIARVAVPEPGILALLGMGMLGMFLSRRRG